jgi:thiosulfate/3-mercaptopyruvate sulfurtransferase
MTPPLIDAPHLKQRLSMGAPVVLLDCSFDLADPAAGERQYAEGHILGAHYAQLERDLSGPKTDAQGRFHGRHPLPARSEFARWLGRMGIAAGTPVVAYDRQGAMFAARAWWLLRWMGHTHVAVLDGGWAAWLAAGGASETQLPQPTPQPPYPDRAAAWPTLDADALHASLDRVRLLDARAPERYRGETEPLDAVAGHIPGAVNRFFKDNLQPDGRFKPAHQLRDEFGAVLGASGLPVVHQCGSGVTACHNLLAMEAAGLAPGALYPGSWSEWSSQPHRPMVRGPG